MQLPSSLLSKLDSEESSLYSSLASSSDLAPDPTAMQAHAEKRLLAMTPEALQVLSETMHGTIPQEKLKAATIVLDRSPATRSFLQPSTVLLPERQLPESAVTSLISALGNMFRSLPSPPPTKQAEALSCTLLVPQKPKSKHLKANKTPKANPSSSPTFPLQIPSSPPLAGKSKKEGS